MRGYLVGAAAISGCGVMVLEMAAVRAVAPYLGASTYTWTNVIGVMLAALAVGYFFGGRLADRVPKAWALFALLVTGGLLMGGLPFAIRPVARWLVPADIGMESAMGAVHRASLLVTILLFAPPTLLLGGVSPMTIRLLVSRGLVGGAAGQVFAASTVGSIAGTFLTTHLLVPTMGTRLTIALAGALLAATGAAGLLLTLWNRRSVVAGAVIVVLAGLSTLGAAMAGPLKVREGQVVETETAYQYVRVLDSGDPVVRLLMINEAEDAYQSVRVAGTDLTEGRYYDYYSVLPLLLGSVERGSLDVLVIGLAAGTIPRQLQTFFPAGLRVTGVEIDPRVLDLGRRFFDLPENSDWLRAVVGDGRVFLNGLPRVPTFDLVIVDAFAQEVYIPFHLATRESFVEIRDRLRPGGIVALNSAGYRPDEELLTVLASTMADVFGRVFRVSVQGYPNYMLFAARDGSPAFSRLARPAGLPPTADGRRLRELAAYVAASTTVATTGGRVLTDDFAPVERLTDAAFRRESRAAMGE
jgi:spermidine synthase